MSLRPWIALAASAVALALPARAAASFSPGDGAIFTQPSPGAVVSVPYSWAVESPAACGAQDPTSSVARAFVQGPPDYLGGAAVPFSQAGYRAASPNYSASGVFATSVPGSYRRYVTLTCNRPEGPLVTEEGSFAVLPLPLLGKTANVAPVRGSPRIRLPGSRTFVPLAAGRQIPFGTEIDTSNNRWRIRIETARPGGGTQTGTQTGIFHAGRFILTQAGSGLTTQRLTEPLSCRRATAYPAAKGTRKRRLWGDAKGTFRTRGSFAAATVRGTVWLVEDRCDGTLTRVKRGTVTVRDLVRNRTVTVRAGRSYFVRAKR
jgi:hypothetical protein